MNSIQKLIATSACVGALMCAGGANAAPAGSETGDDVVSGRPGHAGPYRHARWSKGRHRRGFGGVCGEHRQAKTERLISVVEGLMTFTPRQEAAWNDLTKAVRDGNKSMDDTCAAMKKDRDKPAGATQKLARMEAMMAAGLKFLQSVRPKFDKFYGTLNDKQKKAIDAMSSRRRPH